MFSKISAIIQLGLLFLFPVTLQAQDLLLSRGDTLRISGSWTRTGNIQVYGGVLIAKKAHLNLTGTLAAALGGSILLDSCTILVNENQGYESVWGAAAGSAFRMHACTTTFTHLNMFSSGAGALFSMEQCRNKSASLSGTVDKGAAAFIRNVNYAYEWVVRDSAALYIAQCDSAIVEPAFGSGVTADLTLDTGRILHWELNRNTPGTAGVRCNLTLDTIGNLQWAPYSYPGSSVTFRNSYLRGVLVVMPPPDSAFLEGIISHTLYPDFTFPLLNRTLRFINTRVEVYNFYPGGFYGETYAGSVGVRYQNCLTGDFLVFGNTRLSVRSLNVDGWGGVGKIMGASVVNCTTSVIGTQLTVQDSTLVRLVNSYHTRSGLIVTRKARLVCTGTYLHEAPQIFDSAAVWNANISLPETLQVGRTANILGIAWVDGGSRNSINLLSRQLFWRVADSGSWQPLGAAAATEVRLGILGSWTPASPGRYEIKLVISADDTIIDSAMTIRTVTVLTSSGEEAIPGTVLSIWSARLYGNEIWVTAPQLLNRPPALYDIRGRKHGSFALSGRSTDRVFYKMRAGIPDAAGIYFIHCDAGRETRILRLIL
ncbi:MAG: hypothetical protein JNL74_11915 [Fibrobacteres bacterium]|nr:hypothetical protein [Fibrobacterota bacterium]